MKLRYQLRGLGIGMVLTALLMGVAGGGTSPMSDAEIKARALELGMVESDSLKLTDIVPTQMPESMGGVSWNSGQEPSSNSGGAAGQGSSSNLGGAAGQDPSSNSNGTSNQGSSSNSGDATGQGSSTNSGGATGQEPSTNSGSAIGQGSSTNSAGESTQASSFNPNGVSTQPSNPGGTDTVTIVIEKGEIASEICVKLKEAGVIDDAAVFETYLCENNWSRSIRDGIYNIPLDITMEEIAGIIMQAP